LDLNRRLRGRRICHHLEVTRTTPDVIPAGTMSDAVQPTVRIDDELALRPWRTADAPAVLAAFRDEDVVRWHTRRMHALDQAEEWIESTQNAWTTEQSSGWAIVDVADESVLGRCALHTQLAYGLAEIAYWLLPQARGRGVATRAAVAATRWGHGFGFHRIELEHSTLNLASCAVAERAGFTAEGIKRQSNLHADGPHDMHLHSHLATDPLPDV